MGQIGQMGVDRSQGAGRSMGTICQDQIEGQIGPQVDRSLGADRSSVTDWILQGADRSRGADRSKGVDRSWWEGRLVYRLSLWIGLLGQIGLVWQIGSCMGKIGYVV